MVLLVPRWCSLAFLKRYAVGQGWFLWFKVTSAALQQYAIDLEVVVSVNNSTTSVVRAIATSGVCAIGSFPSCQCARNRALS